jgi:hypothetical protein
MKAWLTAGLSLMLVAAAPTAKVEDLGWLAGQ